MMIYNQVRERLASKGCGVMWTRDFVISVRQNVAHPKGMHPNKGEPT